VLAAAVAGQRFLSFVSTPGAAADWARAAALLVFLAICVVPAGLATGFLRPATARGLAQRKRILLAAAVFVTPALAEEVVFRALPLSLAPKAAWPWAAAASLAAFVVYHPLKVAWPGASAARRATFTNPVFLVCALLLGAVCTLALVTSGSLWPPVALHGTTVAAWLLWLGGYDRLHEQNETTP